MNTNQRIMATEVALSHPILTLPRAVIARVMMDKPESAADSRWSSSHRINDRAKSASGIGYQKWLLSKHKENLQAGDDAFVSWALW